MTDRLLWSDDPEPWGVEFLPSPDGNYWQNRWRVGRENGEGATLALFEFEEHAEAFVKAFGPKAKP